MGGPPLCLRALTAEERPAVEALARSRTAPARRVERAPIIRRAGGGGTTPAGAPSPGEVAAVIAAALTSPRRLGLPFASWTLDRLAAFLREHKGIAMRRSRIDEILLKEGLRWRRQETWFGARVDPEFAEKRGASRRSTPHHPRA